MDGYYYCKRSGQIQEQIPAFGDWDKANDLPITQYFESARQAGLIRYSSSSGETVPYVVGAGDLYGAVVPSRKTRVREKRHTHVNVKEKMRNGNVTQPPRKLILPRDTLQPLHVRPPKPVDEDLYKIPPELLRNSKRNKMRGLFSRCLVPACNS